MVAAGHFNGSGMDHESVKKENEIMEKQKHFWNPVAYSSFDMMSFYRQNTGWYLSPSK